MLALQYTLAIGSLQKKQHGLVIPHFFTFETKTIFPKANDQRFQAAVGLETLLQVV